MKQMFNLYRALILVFFFIFILASCTTNEWPQLFGPESNMVIKTTNLPVEWGDSLNVKWTYEMEGESWSSPIVLGDKIFISSSVLVKKAERPEPKVNEPGENQAASEPEEDKSYLKDVYRWQLTCINAETGNIIWNKISFEGNPRINKHAGSTYACETPVSDGKYVYVYYGMVGVYCYDLKGNLVWEKDLGAYKTLNGWGTGSSPVLFNDHLFIVVDNEEKSFLVALDSENGEEVWKVNRDEKTNYGTPVIWNNNQRTELVVMGKVVRSYDPLTGELFWQLNAGGSFAIPSPVFDSDRIYFGNAGGPQAATNLFAVKAGASGDISLSEGESSNDWVVWSIPGTGISNPSPVLFEGLIYVLASRNGGISCIDATSGHIVFSESIKNFGSSWASPWINNNNLFVMNERGVTQVLKTGREFEVIGENKLKDKFWASVVPTKNAYVFKGEKKVYCVGN